VSLRVTQLVLVSALIGLAILPAQASAGTINVTTTNDVVGGLTCSLRDAVNTANNDTNTGGCADVSPSTAADTIVLDGGDYNLTRVGIDDTNIAGDLDVTEDLTISGAAATSPGSTATARPPATVSSTSPAGP
jgi:hypothetical protein